MLNGVNAYVIDGLDGSGKGSCAEILARLLPGETVIVDYPNYDLPWGKVLRHLLSENDEGLSVEDRMLVYALNRLETVVAIRDLVSGEPHPTNIVFDRFITSNVITAAYYWIKLPLEERPKDMKEWIVRMYNYMCQIDNDFMTELGLIDQAVYVPMLSEEDSIRSLLSDETRRGADLYETTEVQSLARLLYGMLSEEFPDRFHHFSQYKDDGLRMSPKEQALVILKIEGVDRTLPNLGVKRLEMSGKPDYQSLNNLLDRHGSDRLKIINPYPALG